MNLLKNFVGFCISVWEHMENVDPKKLFYNLSWFGGIETLSVFLYIHPEAKHVESEESWLHYFMVVFIVPCVAWLVLLIFRIIVKWFLIEYVCIWFPKIKKYVPQRGEEK